MTNEAAQNTAILAIRNAPIDAVKPIEVVVREQVRKRKLDQNALYHAGPLKDIAEQAYVNGRTFSADTWHYYFKSEFLPEDCETITDELVINPAKYEKWSVTPRGDRILTGSTTDLSVKGFALFIEQVYAYGANLSVQFKVSPNELNRYGGNYG